MADHSCICEGNSEKDCIKFSIIFINLLVICLHGGDVALGFFFHSFNDHADTTDLALAGHKGHCLAIDKLFFDGFNRFIDVDVVDTLIIAFLSDGSYFVYGV
jgi:hypothetical protein